MGKEYIEFNSLDDVILSLNKDNELIKNLINDINNDFKSIDKDMWDSPERNKFDDEFLPYLWKKENKINNSLKNSLDKLISAKVSYEEVNTELRNSAEFLNE